MTHLRSSKRLPRPGPGPGFGFGRALVTVAALVASLGLGAIAPADAASAEAVPVAETTAAAPRWTDKAHGFASLEGGTTGGAGGKVVTVTTQADLERYAAAEEPYVIRVAGTIKAEPFGANVVVASNKTIIGVGTAGELVQGELNLKPGTHNVIIRNLTIRDSYVEGDVDFVYGRATTVIERSVIKALSRGSTTNNGYITAASTWKDNPYGFLITGSKVVSDAPAGSFHLGRPWHPGGNPDAVAQVLFRETELPEAVKSSPWTDMGGFSWQDARFTEYRTYGPGATVNADRPQMPGAEAATHTVSDYLAGTDNWAPHARH